VATQQEMAQVQKDLANYAIEDLKHAGVQEGKFYTHGEVYNMLYAYFRNEYPDYTNEQLDSEVVDVLNMLDCADKENLLETGYRIIPIKHSPQ
jgi:hypothetical protein